LQASSTFQRSAKRNRLYVTYIVFTASSLFLYLSPEANNVQIGCVLAYVSDGISPHKISLSHFIAPPQHTCRPSLSSSVLLCISLSLSHPPYLFLILYPLSFSISALYKYRTSRSWTSLCNSAILSYVLLF